MLDKLGSQDRRISRRTFNGMVESAESFANMSIVGGDLNVVGNPIIASDEQPQSGCWAKVLGVAKDYAGLPISDGNGGHLYEWIEQERYWDGVNAVWQDKSQIPRGSSSLGSGNYLHLLAESMGHALSNDEIVWVEPGVLRFGGPGPNWEHVCKSLSVTPAIQLYCRGLRESGGPAYQITHNSSTSLEIDTVGPGDEASSGVTNLNATSYDDPLCKVTKGTWTFEFTFMHEYNIALTYPLTGVPFLEVDVMLYSRNIGGTSWDFESEWKESDLPFTAGQGRSTTSATRMFAWTDDKEIKILLKIYNGGGSGPDEYMTFWDFYVRWQRS